MATVLYFDCAMGLAGDMVLAALLDAGADRAAVDRAVATLPLDGVELVVERTLKNGFAANRIEVRHPEQHAHRGLSDCLEVVGAATMSDGARGLVARLFRAIAEAEAGVHGTSVEEVHFHEVGAIDSIVDIVGCAVAFDSLGVDTVISGAVPVGRGSVRIAHGVCPLPAPATAALLRGVPLAHSPVEAELTTPTGAAIVAELADRFEPLPPMTIDAIGYGAGSRSFPEHPNLLRVFLGTLVAEPNRDVVDLLETNLDDTTGEIIGHTRERLLTAGALDVYTIPIDMKKDRPGTCLSVLARPGDRDALEQILFQETGTLGVRRSRLERSVLPRQPHVVETPYGRIAGKLAIRPDGQSIFTPEFESCRTIAIERGVPLREVYRAASSAATNESRTSGTTVDAPPSRTGHSHDHAHDAGHSHDHSHDGGHSHG